MNALALRMPSTRPRRAPPASDGDDGQVAEPHLPLHKSPGEGGASLSSALVLVCRYFSTDTVSQRALEVL